MSRTIKALNCRNIADLNKGAAELIIDKAIAEAVADVDDRGEDGKPRRICIEIALTKRQDGLIDSDCSAQAKLPPRRTSITTARPMHKDQLTKLMFETFSDENPDQPAFDVLEDGEVKEN